MVADHPVRFVEALEQLARLGRADGASASAIASAKARLLAGAASADVRAVGPGRGRTLAVALEVVEAPGAIEWLEAAVERWSVAVVAAGFLDGEEVLHRAALRARGLSEHALERIRFVAHKPPADVYLDPRALRFDGAFGEVSTLRAMIRRRQ